MTHSSAHKGVLICPFCKAELERGGNCGASFYCKGERRHCFDIARSGYVSLTRSSGSSGDDKGMVRSRTAFLEKDYYSPFADAVVKAVDGAEIVIDAGCGEGYYSNRIANSHSRVYGFDLSKYACEHASKKAKALSNGAFFGVSSVFELPIADECADAVVSLFAPIAEREFSRVLMSGGRLIVGAAGRHHLIELKRAIYSEAYENDERHDLPFGFELEKCENITYKFLCEDLKSLFYMTPYAFRTSTEDAAKLDKINQLEITADFVLYIYKKVER